MDKSPEYILQCEQAEEIQERWRPCLGDLFLWAPGTTPIVMDEELSVSSTSIWLPHQDQLQEMVKEDAITQIQRLQGWIITANYVPLGLPQPSMEQLWLGFVMKEKFGKAWNGQEWEEISEKIKPVNSEIEVGEIDYDEPAKFIFPFFR